MKIGILVCGHPPDGVDPFSALFQTLLAGHGFTFQAWTVVDMDFPTGPNDADGWLITGSKHGVYEDHPFIPPLETLIRHIHDARRPMVGVCFGHQIIAQALGGRVEKFAGGWCVGRHDYDWNGRPMALNAWHQDQVVKRPAGATPVGTSPFCENAGLAYGGHILTMQPHPEFTAPTIDTLINTRGRGVVPDDLLTQAAHTLPQANDSATMANMIAQFFKQDRS